MAKDDETPPTTEEESTPVEGETTSKAEETRASAQIDDFAQQVKSAAQKVLEERFGMEQKEDGSVDFTKIDSERVKENAQALITGLMSQLAGVAPPPKHEDTTQATADDNVIDLESARRAREPREPSALEQRMSQNIKATFNNYVQSNLVPDDASGQVKLNVDGEMLKEHGPQVLTALFGAFTKSLFPEGGVEVDLPSEPPKEEKAERDAEDGIGPEEDQGGQEADTPSAGDSAPVDVKLSVDMAGLFKSLIEGVQPKK